MFFFNRNSTSIPNGPPNYCADNAIQPQTTNEYLYKLFLETVISYGIPAVFKIVVIVVSASLWRSIRSDKKKGFDNDLNNPAADLYRDLYSGDDEEEIGGFVGICTDLLKGGVGSADDGRQENNNRGIPSKQYITMYNLNQKYDSYEYSITAATQSKAKAAANYRAKKFDRALQLTLKGTGVPKSLSPYVKTKLLQLEKEFLSKGSSLLQEVLSIQTKLTKDVIDDKMEEIGMTSVFELDPKVDSDDGNASPDDAQDIKIKEDDKKISKRSKKKKEKAAKKKMSKQLVELNEEQKKLMNLELDFISDIVETLGSERATGIRMAFLGDIAVRGSGGILTQLQERPLTSILNSLEYSTANHDKEASKISDEALKPGHGKRLYVTNFPGDIMASQVGELREEVTSIIHSARPGDEALVILESGGGTVTGYGLASGQLLRFKEKGIKLTVAVEQVAASGGYMMCCVADKIIGSPFAVFGSIGVMAQIPNVYDRLKKEGVEFQTVTAGKFKRTITPFKKVTEEDLDKTKQDIEDIHTLFRDFVGENRPQLNMSEVATGETWFGTDALKKGLCDEIKTVDNVLLDFVNDGWDVYEVKYTPPKKELVLSTSKIERGRKASSSFSLLSGLKGLVRSSTGWFVQMVASEIRTELTEETTNCDSIQKRYMAKYDQAACGRMQG